MKTTMVSSPLLLRIVWSRLTVIRGNLLTLLQSRLQPYRYAIPAITRHVSTRLTYFWELVKTMPWIEYRKVGELWASSIQGPNSRKRMFILFESRASDIRSWLACWASQSVQFSTFAKD